MADTFTFEEAVDAEKPKPFSFEAAHSDPVSNGDFVPEVPRFEPTRQLAPPTQADTEQAQRQGSISDPVNTAMETMGRGLVGAYNATFAGPLTTPPLKYGEPLVKLAEPLTPEEEASVPPWAAGAYRSISKATTITPELALSLPFMALKPVQAAIALQQGLTVPGQVSHAKDVLSDPNATAIEKAEAVADPAITTGFAALAGHGALSREGAISRPTETKPVTEPVTLPKEENASSQQETAAIHGDVPSQPVRSEGQVPVEESGQGVLTPKEAEKEVAPREAIGKELGLGVRDPIRNLWQFDVTDPKDGQPAGFSIKEGSTLEEVKAKADKLRADLAERLPEEVSKMTPDEFNKFAGTDATGKGYELAKNIGTEGDRTAIESGEKAATEELASTMTKLKEAAPEQREATFNEAQVLNAKKQYFNEAGRMLSAMDDVKKGSTVEEAAKKNGVSEPRLADASKPPEPPAKPTATGGSGKDVTGIAQRVREKVAAAGQERLSPIGEGISAPDSTARGEALLKADPDAADKAMFQFENDPNKAVSADAMAVGRAKLRQLAQVARSLEAKGGPEYEAAFKARSDWAARMKKMQTEWHKSGMAQQGEQDIDTGTFTGLREAYTDATGKDFTPEQKGTAKKFAARVSKQAGEVTEGKEKLANELRQTIGTPEQKKVWDKVKEYLDQGMDDFDDIRVKAATDLGMTVKDVTDILTQKKKAKALADDLWKKQEQLRRFKAQAQRWLKSTALPGYQRALSAIPRTLFAMKVGFHGTVALGTHAPVVFFQPPKWGMYFRDFGKMYRMVGSPKYYEMQVQELLRKPNYIRARRAGLQNDPSSYEDYNSPLISQYIGKISGMGNRGYSVLKILRQDMFDQHWNSLPKTAQIDEMASAIADGVNHATGVVKGAAPKGSNVVLFAPRLEASRVMWLAGDPLRAANTFATWKKASAAEKEFAITQVKEKAWVAGTLLGLLGLNQGVLSLTGSKQKVNFDDPFHSDWLKFKAAGMTVSYGNAMLAMARLPVRMYQIRGSDGGKLKNLVYPDENSYSVLGEYARSQLSPFASLAADLWFKGDWQNRPLPNSNRPVPKRLRAQGVYPYTWPEFWTEQVLPIPAEEAVREVWKDGLGMSAEQEKAARKALATLTIMSATGARLTDDIPKPIKK